VWASIDSCSFSLKTVVTLPVYSTILNFSTHLYAARKTDQRVGVICLSVCRFVQHAPADRGAATERYVDDAPW